MKACPSCGEMVPEAATRCKECFHDFTEQPHPRSGGPLALLVAVAGMAIVGALTLGYIVSKPLEERILVDESTHSVVWTRLFRGGIETETLKWDEIIRLEYVITQGGDFEIVALTTDGERKVIMFSADRPLSGEAERYARIMEKPLETVDNTRGFHKLAQ